MANITARFRLPTGGTPGFVLLDSEGSLVPGFSRQTSGFLPILDAGTFQEYVLNYPAPDEFLYGYVMADNGADAYVLVEVIGVDVAAQLSSIRPTVARAEMPAGENAGIVYLDPGGLEAGSDLYMMLFNADIGTYVLRVGDTHPSPTQITIMPEEMAEGTSLGKLNGTSGAMPAGVWYGFIFSGNKDSPTHTDPLRAIVPIFFWSGASIFAPLPPREVRFSSVVDSESATVFYGDSSLSSVNDQYTNSAVVFVSGELQSVTRPIVNYVGSSRGFLVSPALPSAPAVGDIFYVLGFVAQ